MYDQNYKLILWLWEIPIMIGFLRRLHTKKMIGKFSFGKFLVSKDGSPAVRIDEEIKPSKFMMGTENF